MRKINNKTHLAVFVAVWLALKRWVPKVLKDIVKLAHLKYSIVKTAANLTTVV